MKDIEENEALKNRLLVLEDDRSIRQTNVELLARAGFVVDSAEDGEAGWQAIRAKQYDLVLTDLDMPHLSGFDLLCRMRAAGINTPVVLVTGSFNLDERMLEVFSAVLHKPFHLYELVITVQRVLHRSPRLAGRKAKSPESIVQLKPLHPG